MSRIGYVLNTYAAICYTPQLPKWIEAPELQTVGGDPGEANMYPKVKVHLPTRSTTLEDPRVILMVHVSNSA